MNQEIQKLSSPSVEKNNAEKVSVEKKFELIKRFAEFCAQHNKAGSFLNAKEANNN